VLTALTGDRNILKFLENAQTERMKYVYTINYQ